MKYNNVKLEYEFNSRATTMLKLCKNKKYKYL